MGAVTGSDRSTPKWRLSAVRRLRILWALLPLGGGLTACSVAIPVSTTAGSRAQLDEIPATLVALAPNLTAEDWRRAREALGIALDPRGNGASVRWDNPETGLEGRFNPVGGPVVTEGDFCREFSGTIRSGVRDVALRGTACHQWGDDWAVTDMRS